MLVRLQQERIWLERKVLLFGITPVPGATFVRVKFPKPMFAAGLAGHRILLVPDTIVIVPFGNRNRSSPKAALELVWESRLFGAEYVSDESAKIASTVVGEDHLTLPMATLN